MPVTGGEWQVYTVTSANSTAPLTGATAQLNGVPLVEGDDGSLPPLVPVNASAGAPIALPPYSYTFVRVPAALPACRAAPDAQY